LRRFQKRLENRIDEYYKLFEPSKYGTSEGFSYGMLEMLRKKRKAQRKRRNLRTESKGLHAFL